jgi:cytidylate kinase
MKEEFVKAYETARLIAEERYKKLYKYDNYNINIHDIDQDGMKFHFEEFSRGCVVGYEYVTVTWDEL